MRKQKGKSGVPQRPFTEFAGGLVATALPASRRLLQMLFAASGLVLDCWISGATSSGNSQYFGRECRSQSQPTVSVSRHARVTCEPGISASHLGRHDAHCRWLAGICLQRHKIPRFFFLCISVWRYALLTFKTLKTLNSQPPTSPSLSDPRTRSMIPR